MKHMHSYLMCSTRLQHTLHYRHISETLNHPIVGHCVFPNVGVFHHGHLELIAGFLAMLPTIVPSFSEKSPHTTATYSRRVVL